MEHVHGYHCNMYVLPVWFTVTMILFTIAFGTAVYHHRGPRPLLMDYIPAHPLSPWSKYHHQVVSVSCWLDLTVSVASSVASVLMP